MSKIFKGETIDRQPAITGATWSRVQLEAAQHRYFIVEVRAYDEKKEISSQQNKYIHAVIVPQFRKQLGLSDDDTKMFLKNKFGRQLFFFEVEEGEHRRGRIMFECQYAHCQSLFLLPLRFHGDKFVCPNCKKGGIRMFFVLSMAELNVNQTSDFLEACWAGYEHLYQAQIERPNREWRLAKGKK